MYSDSLERFIDVILSGGFFYDEEREALHKRAEREGIDAEEIDVYVEGRLREKRRKKEQEEAEAKAEAEANRQRTIREIGEAASKSLDESRLDMNQLTKQVDLLNRCVIYRLRENYPLKETTEFVDNLFICIELVVEEGRDPYCRIRGGFVPTGWLIVVQGVFEEFTLNTNVGQFHVLTQQGDYFASMLVDGAMMRKLFTVNSIQGGHAKVAVYDDEYKKLRSHVNEGDFAPTGNESFGNYVRRFYKPSTDKNC